MDLGDGVSGPFCIAKMAHKPPPRGPYGSRISCVYTNILKNETKYIDNAKLLLILINIKMKQNKTHKTKHTMKRRQDQCFQNTSIHT